MPLFFIFILLPILELVVFIKVGAKIGALAVIGLIFLSSIFGMMVLRVQGFLTLASMRARVQQGGLPARELAQGVLLGVAGVLLIIPGFITSALGLVMLLPWVRKAMVGVVVGKFFPQGQARTFYRDSAVGEKDITDLASAEDIHPPKLPKHRPQTFNGEFKRED